MRLSVAIIAAGAFALAGCNVSVTSNDAATQNAIDDVQAGASDLVNGAGNIAADAGEELGNAARDTGNTLGNIADSIDGGTANKSN